VSFIVLLIIFFPRYYIKKPDWEHLPLVRIRNTAAIGEALSNYQFDHNGRLPNQLSELVPKYILPANIRYFFWPLESKDFTNLSIEELSHEIDDNGAFVYLGKRGVEANMLLYQRTNLTTNLGITNFMVLTTNFTPAALSIEDVEARLHSLE
jgi:hypothetical protein